LFETLGWSDRAWSRRLGIASVRLLFACAQAELEVGRPCLVEGNFRPEFAHDDFRELRQRVDFTLVQIFCTASRETLVRRYAERARAGERHPGHLESVQTEEVAALFDADVYEPLVLEGMLLTVDTTDPDGVDYPRLVTAIREVLENGET
jgi:RNase adaptor protein for sRNA GlmZ degradation